MVDATANPMGWPSGVLHTRTEYVDGQLADACSRLTLEPREPRGTAPLGLAFVIALRTLMDWGQFPDGGIMIGHEAEWVAPIDVPTTLQTTLALNPTGTRRRGRTKADLLYRSVSLEGHLIIQQRQTVLWPE